MRPKAARAWRASPHQASRSSISNSARVTKAVAVGAARCEPSCGAGNPTQHVLAARFCCLCAGCRSCHFFRRLAQSGPCTTLLLSSRAIEAATTHRSGCVSAPRAMCWSRANLSNAMRLRIAAARVVFPDTRSSGSLPGQGSPINSVSMCRIYISIASCYG